MKKHDFKAKSYISVRMLPLVRMVRPKRTLTECPDPEDNRLLECAAAAAADYLITGNKRHFPTRWRKIMVVNAREFLEITGPELWVPKKS